MEASVLLRSSLTSFTYELIARLPTHCSPEEAQVAFYGRKRRGGLAARAMLAMLFGLQNRRKTCIEYSIPGEELLRNGHANEKEAMPTMQSSNAKARATQPPAGGRE